MSFEGFRCPRNNYLWKDGVRQNLIKQNQRQRYYSGLSRNKKEEQHQRRWSQVIRYLSEAPFTSDLTDLWHKQGSQCQIATLESIASRKLTVFRLGLTSVASTQVFIGHPSWRSGLKRRRRKRRRERKGRNTRIDGARNSSSTTFQKCAHPGSEFDVKITSPGGEIKTKFIRPVTPILQLLMKM